MELTAAVKSSVSWRTGPSLLPRHPAPARCRAQLLIIDESRNSSAKTTSSPRTRRCLSTAWSARVVRSRARVPRLADDRRQRRSLARHARPDGDPHRAADQRSRFATDPRRRQLRRPTPHPSGEAIYNDAGGLVEANSPFQCLAPRRPGDEFLTKVLEKTKRENAFYGEPAVVFEGNAPADITKNRALLKLLEHGAPSKPTRAPGVDGRACRRSKIQPASPCGRQSGSNVPSSARPMSWRKAIMVSAMSPWPPSTPKAARSSMCSTARPPTRRSSHVRQDPRDHPHEVKMTTSAPSRSVDRAGREQARRQGSYKSAEAPEIYVIIYGLQRYRPLRKT